jgi:hypothetical protein
MYVLPGAIGSIALSFSAMEKIPIHFHPALIFWLFLIPE